MDGEAKVHHAHYMQEDVEVRDQVFEEVRVPKFDECEDTLVLHDFERVRICSSTLHHYNVLTHCRVAMQLSHYIHAFAELMGNSRPIKYQSFV